MAKPLWARHCLWKCVRDIPLYYPVHGSGLLWDEACCFQMCADEIKAVLDLEHGRSMSCRHVDGWIPSATPRVFSTNHRQSYDLPLATANFQQHRGKMHIIVAKMEIKNGDCFQGLLLVSTACSTCLVASYLYWTLSRISFGCKNWVCWVTGMNISIGPIGYMLYKQSSGSNRNLGYVTSMQHWIGYAA